jgi:hypothetical protein
MVPRAPSRPSQNQGAFYIFTNQGSFSTFTDLGWLLCPHRRRERLCWLGASDHCGAVQPREMNVNHVLPGPTETKLARPRSIQSSA